MNAELLINVTPQESRVALLSNGILQEVHIERASHKGIVGNVYKGKVSRVLPGMEAAFINIGLEKAAFLHASDLTPRFKNVVNNTVNNTVNSTVSNNVKGVDSNEVSSASSSAPPKIAELLHEGKNILVQVIKDPLGTKGARLTTYITIPSRSLVLVPEDNSLGVSSKIEDPEERERLKALVEKLRSESEDDYGFIIRTAAEGVDESTLRADMAFLGKQWAKIKENSVQAKKPSALYSDLPLVQRVLRDMVGESIEKVRIDSRETLASVNKFCTLFIPEILNVIEHYPGERPIFDIYGVEDEIHKALERQVQLKSGGLSDYRSDGIHDNH